MREVLCQIYSKEYIFLLLLASAFLITVACAELSYYDMSNQESVHQNQVLNRTSDILYLTSNATNLMMDINYFDLGKQASYSNNFTTTNFIGASLDLHFLNERLRDLSLSNYSVPSMISGVNYS